VAINQIHTSRAARWLRTARPEAVAAVVAVAYYAGSMIGLKLLRPWPATTSVIWPPNATVTAILLFVPFSRWWSVLAGAAIAHFAIQLGVWSPGFVAWIFLTNCIEALVAAGAIRAISDAPDRVDTLRRMTVFLVCGAWLAPFVSSFFDAEVVKLFNHEDYWTVWKLRLFSNVLAQLALVPAIAGVLNNSGNIRRWSVRRWLEAGTIAAALIVVATAIILDAGNLGLVNTPLAPFLPLLFWAAVRFGSTGVGLSVVGMFLVVVATAGPSSELYRDIPLNDRVRVIQLFLISATMPILCVGALVEERRKMLKALGASHRMKSSIVDSIPNLVAVVDRDGRIRALNESWREAHAHHLLEVSCVPGASLLDACAAAADEGSPYGRAAYDGLKQVLERTAPGFTIEHRWTVNGDDRWWLMSVVPLKSANGGAVITKTDITARKRAELDAQRTRDELAHTTRVWVMGELTASLSHQLNQPLTGIMANANAGRRYLRVKPLDLVEMDQILADIIADAERASDVTRAVRDMLRKDASEPELIDVNDVVRDTTMLVVAQAARRGVAIRLDLAPSIPLVPGKRVQLSQVVLNLTMNAIEATADQLEPHAQSVTVRTEPYNGCGVHVSVADTGCGLPPGDQDQMFEPLFTTKPSGMGMGLPIARAMVEAHGGSMWARSAETAGAIFHFTLPGGIPASVATSRPGAA
jgi:signal transduction histidine kinase/integral membrane sensor domain MASE1